MKTLPTILVVFGVAATVIQVNATTANSGMAVADLLAYFAGALIFPGILAAIASAIGKRINKLKVYSQEIFGVVFVIISVLAMIGTMA